MVPGSGIPDPVRSRILKGKVSTMTDAEMAHGNVVISSMALQALFTLNSPVLTW